MVCIRYLIYIQSVAAFIIHFPAVTGYTGIVEGASAIVEGASAIQSLITLFSSDEEHIKDLTAAEEVVRGLTFDLFEENISCAEKNGIKVEDYSFLVNRFATRFSIPDHIRDSILDGQYVQENKEIVLNFKFKKGEKGGFVYGRIATVKKRGGEIDMAYSVYNLEFKLSPKVIQHERKKKFLGFFKYGKEVWQETQERDMSITDKSQMQAYFMHQAITGFKKHYSPLLEAKAHKEL